jgi:hypothetical protein
MSIASAPPSALADFPAQFCYPVATPEAQDQFLQLVGRMIGEEQRDGTLTATSKLEEVLRAAKAHILLADLPRMRQLLRERVAAHEFIQSHDESVLERELDKATSIAEKAAKKLADALAACEVAEAAQLRAAQLLETLTAAKAEMDKADLTVLAAFEVLT